MEQQTVRIHIPRQMSYRGLAASLSNTSAATTSTQTDESASRISSGLSPLLAEGIVFPPDAGADSGEGLGPASNQAPVDPGRAEPLEPAPAAIQHGGSWRAAWRSGGWSALREASGQSIGTFAGLGLRSFVESMSPTAMAATSVVAAAAFGAQVYRSSSLMAAALYPRPEGAPMSVRIALGVTPVLAAAAAAGFAASAGTLGSAGAYLASKLVERCVRDLCSNAMTGVFPSSEIVDAAGMAVHRADLDHEDWGRAAANALPAVGMLVLQEYFAPAPAISPGAAVLVAGLPYVAAKGLVEAGRAISGTLITAKLAHTKQRRLADKPAGGLAQLTDNLSSVKTLRQSADSTAMRQSLGVYGDMVGVVAGSEMRSGPIIGRLSRMVIRSVLKASSEARTPLTSRGQAALQRGRPENPAAVMGDTGVICPADFLNPGAEHAVEDSVVEITTLNDDNPGPSLWSVRA